MCHYILSVNDDRLVGADEMAATVLLVARFVGIVAERLFLAVADGAQAIGRDAEGD